ncbi:hypothetical protein MCOR27_010992 [Pyricularia oryzae]|uniref:Uncharacterized protein n=2 Tax=Pyricularia TaxID=48558 RepID=A0ABQ8N260_PYRGI|nr:hypothetical protein MCOR01_005594 [Pyricularia oryzae]KAI6289974.1 hypothetical protein MCOR33_011611 [Pyricularia grisea]KAH9434797.1 hypothetical protein MCOR02_003760 [Pyricularia oryzae]KAI6252974.1 hypothetical protein MCOR19_010441 [Pyricularia oryzae]KAI6266515.1 hypothetical protein MCOR27_010992 [Pyricularia oryzae]
MKFSLIAAVLATALPVLAHEASAGTPLTVARRDVPIQADKLSAREATRARVSVQKRDAPPDPLKSRPDHKDNGI